MVTLKGGERVETNYTFDFNFENQEVLFKSDLELVQEEEN